MTLVTVVSVAVIEGSEPNSPGREIAGTALYGVAGFGGGYLLGRKPWRRRQRGPNSPSRPMGSS